MGQDFPVEIFKKQMINNNKEVLFCYQPLVMCPHHCYTVQSDWFQEYVGEMAQIQY